MRWQLFKHQLKVNDRTVYISDVEFTQTFDSNVTDSVPVKMVLDTAGKDATEYLSLQAISAEPI